MGPPRPTVIGLGMPMKTLLTITAAIETGAGLALALAPALGVSILLGSSLDTPAGLIMGRILGAALFSLWMACGFARGDSPGRSVAGLISAMLLYNLAVVSLLGYARIGLGMSGLGLWPTALLHSTLAVWCVGCLRIERRKSRQIHSITNGPGPGESSI
jgi:hypothetical protein